MAVLGVVLNPAKLDDVAKFKEIINQEARHLIDLKSGVKFFETTVEDSGFQQTLDALTAGCTKIIAVGGDGTVRQVAGALAKYQADGAAKPSEPISMGIIPAGTGNLMARNCDIPINRPADALKIALSGQTKKIDVGWISHGIDLESARSANKEPFLVIAGFGFDAVVMEQTDARLKKYVGWMAYVVAGIKNIVGRSQYMRLTLDDQPAKRLSVRTLMIGNVGKLQGGVNLMPQAEADSGYLEVLTLDWKGAAGFGQIVRKLLLPKAKLLLENKSEQNTFKGKQVRVSSRKEIPVQIDGDYVGSAKHLRAEIEHHAISLHIGPEPKFRQWINNWQNNDAKLFKVTGKNKH